MLIKQKGFRILADLRFSICILLIISACSILGTIIEQDQSIESYKLNYPLTNPIFGFLSWDIILKIGLDHVYKTWWFFGLILLFGCSLTLCSFLQQLPGLKIARRCQFFRTTNPFYRLKISTSLTNFSFNQFLRLIKYQHYSIFHQKNMVYCYKGLIGRIAPIIVHFSMISILLGTIIGSLFGFKAQESVPKTENFHLQNIVTNGPSTIISQSSARVNDFWITYTSTKTISQFYSDLSILDSEGNEINRKTISVNDPLIKNSIYYYQTDWNLVGLRIKTEGQRLLEYPLINIFGNSEKVWLSWLPNYNLTQNGIITVINNLQGYCSLYKNTGEFLGNLELHETTYYDQSINLFEIISSTGLQIKMDPGIPIIYFGFFFLMISTLISYITYSQIWIIQQQNRLFIGGTTNRAIFEFELEFFQFLR